MGSKTLTVGGKRWREKFSLDRSRNGIMDDAVVEALMAVERGDEGAGERIVAVLFDREREFRLEFYSALSLLAINVATTHDSMTERYLRGFPHFGRWWNTEMMDEDTVESE